MPGNHIPEGTVIGALSFVPAGFSFEPWAVYRHSDPPNRRPQRDVRAQADALRKRLDAMVRDA
jgi:hypothetical protein